VTASIHKFAMAAYPEPAGDAWLPRGGLRNGIDADLWAPIVVVAGPVAVRLLAAFAVAEVPALAVPTRSVSSDEWRMWVGTGQYATAEQVMHSAMPDIPLTTRTGGAKSS
jgi:hypothetical protein